MLDWFLSLQGLKFGPGCWVLLKCLGLMDSCVRRLFLGLKRVGGVLALWVDCIFVHGYV